MYNAEDETCSYFFRIDTHNIIFFYFPLTPFTPTHPVHSLLGTRLQHSYPFMFRMSFVSAPTYIIRSITFRIITWYNLESLPWRLYISVLIKCKSTYGNINQYIWENLHLYVDFLQCILSKKSRETCDSYYLDIHASMPWHCMHLYVNYCQQGDFPSTQ